MRAARILPLVLACALTGCADMKLEGALVPNVPPSLEITDSPIAQGEAQAAHYVVTLRWSGNDADGRVDSYDYAVDPARDTAWVRTERNEVTLFLPSTTVNGAKVPVPRGTDHHTIVLRATDNQGAHSPVVHRSFYSYTIAPSVHIVDPLPSKLLSTPVGPSTVIHWIGSDPDGQLRQKPRQYKYKLFDLSDPETLLWLIEPDSLRRRDAPTGFADWDSVGGDTTSVRYAGFALGQQFLFALVGFDEAGAYSPVFSLDENMLVFRIESGTERAPHIRIHNAYVDYTYPTGGYVLDPSREIRLEMPAGERLEFEWEAFPSPGAFIESYRWVLDAQDLGNELPRADEERDWTRWSRAGNGITGCRIGPFEEGIHFLYLEARDSNGLTSLGIVKFTVVRPLFERELLVVDDTRLEVDRRSSSGCLQPYTKAWPSATELDTFLYARGGVPWRCAVNPPSGALSPPGLLSGYAFDTLGTRLGLANPASAAPLSLLGRYRNVVWLLDPDGAVRPDNVDIPTLTTLYEMSRPGSQSALATYVRMGGRLWLLGGGAAYATLIHFDKAKNNLPSTTFFDEALGEIASPMLMHDAVHWRSRIAVTRATTQMQRSPAADRVALSPWTHFDPHTGGLLTAPDYRRLPRVLRLKAPETDPMPASRAADRSHLVYPFATALELLASANSILEDVDPDPEVVRMQPVLDTLYEASGGSIPGTRLPLMTYYHGAQSRQTVFTGLPLWLLARDDAQAVADFVLGDLWGLRRAGSAGGRAAGAGAGERPRARPAP